MNAPPEIIIEEVEKLRGTGVNVGMFTNEDPARPHVVRFALDTAFLNKYTAKQWGIVPKKPVVIQLKFEDTYTAASDIPGVFIFQSSDSRLSEPTLNDYETEFGVVQWFLETRLTEVLRSNWEKRPDAVRAGTLPSTTSTSTSTAASSTTSSATTPTKSPSTTTSTPPRTATANTTASPTTTATLSTTSTTSTVPTTSIASTAFTTPSTSTSSLNKRRDSGIDLSIIPIDETLLAQLIAVGFSEERSRAALRRFTNDFEMALNLLLTNSDEQVDSETQASEGVEKMDVDNNYNNNRITR